MGFIKRIIIGSSPENKEITSLREKLVSLLNQYGYSSSSKEKSKSMTLVHNDIFCLNVLIAELIRIGYCDAGFAYLVKNNTYIHNVCKYSRDDTQRENIDCVFTDENRGNNFTLKKYSSINCYETIRPGQNNSINDIFKYFDYLNVFRTQSGPFLKEKTSHLVVYMLFRNKENINFKFYDEWTKILLNFWINTFNTNYDIFKQDIDQVQEHLNEKQLKIILNNISKSSEKAHPWLNASETCLAFESLFKSIDIEKLSKEDRKNNTNFAEILKIIGNFNENRWKNCMMGGSGKFCDACHSIKGYKKGLLDWFLWRVTDDKKKKHFNAAAKYSLYAIRNELLT